jgi:surface protein
MTNLISYSPFTEDRYMKLKKILILLFAIGFIFNVAVYATTELEEGSPGIKYTTQSEMQLIDCAATEIEVENDVEISSTNQESRSGRFGGVVIFDGCLSDTTIFNMGVWSCGRAAGTWRSPITNTNVRGSSFQLLDDGTLEIGPGYIRYASPAPIGPNGRPRFSNAVINGTTRIVFTDPTRTYLTSVPSLFQNFEDLEEIIGLENVNTTGLNNVSGTLVSPFNDTRHMFRNMASLQELDLSNFDTSNVTSMSEMFNGANQLSSLTLGENFSFVNGVEANLPEIDAFGYTGYWEHTTIDGLVLTSTELMETFDGETMAGTFVWQEVMCGDEYCIDANHIVMGTFDAITSTDAMVVQLSDASVWRSEDSSVSGTVRVEDVLVIEARPGVYELVLYAAEEPDVRITIEVTVADFHHVEMFGDYAIGFNRIMMGRIAANELAEGERCKAEFSQTEAWNIRTGDDLEVETSTILVPAPSTSHEVVFNIVGNIDASVTVIFNEFPGPSTNPEGPKSFTFPPRR